MNNVTEISPINPQIVDSAYKTTNTFDISKNYSQNIYEYNLPLDSTRHNTIQHEKNADTIPNTNTHRIVLDESDTICPDNYNKLRNGKCQEKCPDDYIKDSHICIKTTIIEPIKYKPDSSNIKYICGNNYNLTNVCKDTSGTIIDVSYNLITDTIFCSLSGFTVQKICKSNNNKDIENEYKRPREEYQCGLDENFQEDILNKTDDYCYKCPRNHRLNNNYKCFREDRKIINTISGICTDSYNFDISNNKCVKINCPPNFIFNNENNMCEQYSCPENYTFNNTSKKCIANNRCPPNYTYNNNMCEQYRCPPNFTYDVSNNNCKSTNTNGGSCLNGTFDISSNRCKICNGTDIDNKCLKCEDDTELVLTRDGHKCAKCPKDYIFDKESKQCKTKNYYCNNQIQEGNIPKPCFTCPPNYYFNDKISKCIHDKCSINNIIDNKCYDCDGFIQKTQDGNIKCYTCPPEHIHDKNDINKCIPLYTNSQPVSDSQQPVSDSQQPVSDSQQPVSNLQASPIEYLAQFYLPQQSTEYSLPQEQSMEYPQTYQSIDYPQTYQSMEYYQQSMEYPQQSMEYSQPYQSAEYSQQQSAEYSQPYQSAEYSQQQSAEYSQQQSAEYSQQQSAEYSQPYQSAEYSQPYQSAEYSQQQSAEYSQDDDDE
jgi:hypothetical protein